MQTVSVKLGLGVVVHVFGGHVVQACELVHAHHVSRVLVGQRRMHLVHRHGVHWSHLVLLLPLHPAVLEPDLDLPLGEAKRVSNFYSPPSGQVSVEVELFLQLQGLVPGVWGPLPFCFTILIHCVWKVKKTRFRDVVVSRKKMFFVVCPRVINDLIVTNGPPRSTVSTLLGWLI